MMKLIRFASVAAIALALHSCAIEPPLKLAATSSTGEVIFPEVQTDISVIWDIDTDWKTSWWYGWDQQDIDRWGAIDYPVPTNYEVRIYYFGAPKAEKWLDLERNTIWGSTFSRRFKMGFHDMLFWSNIDSPEGVQSLIVDESDASDIHATTSRSRLSYRPPVNRGGEVRNSPDIFYATNLQDFYVSDRPEDYDYYDAERNVWIKKLSTELTPMVYTYLVQIVIYNNKGRITGSNDLTTISSLADGVSVHTGQTSKDDIVVAFETRMKKDLPAKNGTHADIIGGKLTTFGLCDMKPWAKSRGRGYTGSRGDLKNDLMIDLAFSNSSDAVFKYDITKQLQSQAHGGVVTVEINADTITIPDPGHTSLGAIFHPTVDDRDEVDVGFDM